MEVNRYDGQGRPVINNLVVEKELVVGGKVFLDTSIPEVTISSGAITVTSSLHKVDTESNDATDDLETINGGAVGQLLLIRAANDARTVVAKDNTGNLRLAGDFSLDGAKDSLFLWFDGNQWAEISRSSN